MSYISFKNRYIGKRIDYDRVYGYQCVDLVKQYARDEYGLSPTAWGNAVDYWYNTHKDLYKKFTRVSTKEARIGDMVILKGVNGNPYGHIGIANKSAGRVTVQILEQNGSTGNGSGRGGDAIRLRYIPKWRILGVLRPRSAKPVLRMPPVGSKIRLQKGISRGVFKAGTTRVVKRIYPRDNTYVYFVRGYDPKYSNRILINSGKSRGVALALYYFNGKIIGGWKRV